MLLADDRLVTFSIQFVGTGHARGIDVDRHLHRVAPVAHDAPEQRPTPCSRADVRSRCAAASPRPARRRGSASGYNTAPSLPVTVIEFSVQPAHRGRHQMRDRGRHRRVHRRARRRGQHHRRALRLRRPHRERRRTPHREHHARAVDAADVHDGAFELALQRALIVHLLVEVALPHGRMIEQAEVLGAAAKARARFAAAHARWRTRARAP